MSREKKQNWYTNPRKYHFIYKTTCSVNGKYYYGMHSTDDLEDGYVGSGTMLWHSIKKHGRENFKLEILEFCSDRESLKQREAELITEEMLNDPMCMNLTLGGEGGWDTVNKNTEVRKIRSHNMTKQNKTRWLDPNWIEQQSKRKTRQNKQLIKEGRLKSWKENYSWKGKKHSEETKAKMRDSLKGKQSGNKNSQFGTCWIYHGEYGNKKIKIESIQDYLDQGWIRRRKLKGDFSLIAPVQGIGRPDTLRTY